MEQETLANEYYAEARVQDEQIVNLNELLYFFWEKRLYIYKITVGFIIAGLLVALLSKVEYEASATLLPESQSSQGVASDLLRQYGGLLGIGGGAMNATTISPGLYPDIVKSLPYQAELMNTPLKFSELDTTMTPYQYFTDMYTPSLLTYLKRYTIGLPGQIASLFKGSDPSESGKSVISNVDRDAVTSVSSLEMKTIRELQNRIEISEEQGLVTLTAEMPDANAAAELGQAGIRLLKEYVREYRTQKAKDELRFVEQQVENAEERFQEAQAKLAEFRDSNLNIATAKARTREQELQSQYQLAFNLYNSLSQNLEQAKIKVQEDTPVFTTVEPIIIPRDSSTPNVKLILAICIFTGFVLSLAYIILSRQWDEFQAYKIGKE